MTDSFDDDALRAAYASSIRGSDTDHRADCPSPEALLAASRSEGTEEERLHTFDRALACAACRSELALLQSVSGGGTALRLVSAHDARTGTSRDIPGRQSWKRFAPFAAAASIIIAVGSIGVSQWRAKTNAEVTRGTGASTDITLVSPAETSAIAAGNVTFIWRSTPGVLRYTLEVDTPDGTVLVTATSKDTIQTVRNLTAGERRWSVRAAMDDGSVRRSVSRALRLQ